MKKIVKVKELINDIIDLATVSGKWQIFEKANRLNELIDDETIITSKDNFEYNFDQRYSKHVKMFLVAKNSTLIRKEKCCNVWNQGKSIEYFDKIKEKMLFDLQEEIEDENN